MSQQQPQNPGGYGGAPAGYGPAGPPPGVPAGAYAPGPQGYVGQAPVPGNQSGNNKRQVWLALGLGCGLLTLLAVGATVAVLFWIRNRASSAVEEVQRQLASASAAIAAAPVAVAPLASAALSGAAIGSAAQNAELSGDCALAHICCKAIAVKATGNAAAEQACDVFKTAGYPTATCTTSLDGYRKVAKAVGATCD